MKYYTTKIRAIDPKDGVMKTWGGPNVPGISWEDADHYCQNNGLGYCEIDGELVMEIPCNEDFTPDWDSAIDYDIPNLN